MYEEQLLDHMQENCLETLWGEPVRDTVEIIDEIEHDIIDAFGCNLAGTRVSDPSIRSFRDL